MNRAKKRADLKRAGILRGGYRPGPWARVKPPEHRDRICKRGDCRQVVPPERCDSKWCSAACAYPFKSKKPRGTGFYAVRAKAARARRKADRRRADARAARRRVG